MFKLCCSRVDSCISAKRQSVFYLCVAAAHIGQTQTAASSLNKPLAVMVVFSKTLESARFVRASEKSTWAYQAVNETRENAAATATAFAFSTNGRRFHKIRSQMSCRFSRQTTCFHLRNVKQNHVSKKETT